MFNSFQERKLGKTRNEENKKSDSVAIFLGVPEQENLDSSNYLTVKSFTEMPNHPSEHVCGKSNGTSKLTDTFIMDNKSKMLLERNGFTSAS